jgi:hypothetical protein
MRGRNSGLKAGKEGSHQVRMRVQTHAEQAVARRHSLLEKLNERHVVLPLWFCACVRKMHVTYATQNDRTNVQAKRLQLNRDNNEHVTKTA